MSSIKFRKPYDGSRMKVALSCPDGLTKQAMKDECDINRIMAKYRQTGLIDHLSQRPMRFTDVSDALPYHEALDFIMSAQEAFEALPAVVRKHFDNDPALFIAASDDPEQRQTFIDLGLIDAPTETPEAREAEPATEQSEGASGG